MWVGHVWAAPLVIRAAAIWKVRRISTYRAVLRSHFVARRRVNGRRMNRCGRALSVGARKTKASRIARVRNGRRGSRSRRGRRMRYGCRMRYGRGMRDRSGCTAGRNALRDARRGHHCDQRASQHRFEKALHVVTRSRVPFTVTYVPCAVLSRTRTVCGASSSDESGKRCGWFVTFRKTVPYESAILCVFPF